jgi:predicted transport protein
MKNILFLIGNGFDLNLGLRTKFSDVAEKYIKDHENTSDLNIQKFKKELVTNYEKWADFEREMGEYTKTFDPSNKNDLASQIDSFREILIRKLGDEESRVEYNTNKEHIFTVFRKSLTSFIDYLPAASKLTISPIISASSKNMNFCYDFITFNYTNVLDKCIGLIKSDKERSSRNKVNFRTTVNADQRERYVADTLGKVLHIHGTLQKGLILGVDNASQITNRDLSNDEDIQWMIKPYVNNELGEHNDIEAKKLIDRSSIICVFGMSIGETDKTWWDYLISWLKTDETKHLIIFFYNDKIDETNPRMIINNKKEVKNKFFSIVGNVEDEERKQCENRIHIPSNNSDMFKLKLLKGKSEKGNITINNINVASRVYKEEEHLNKTEDQIKQIYLEIKSRLLAINPSLIFNPQRYYISIKNKINISFIKIRRKKIRIIIMLDFKTIKENIRGYAVKELSQGVQAFYNGSCAAVDIEKKDNIGEVIKLIKRLI